MTAQQELNTYRETEQLPERLTKRFLRLLNEEELERIARQTGPGKWDDVEENEAEELRTLLARYLRVQEVRREKNFIK